ncbi:hypothetical protein [Bacillus sp. AFS073361]|nr:hypothetical protein [Bacillus sp. AFS073361]
MEKVYEIQRIKQVIQGIEGGERYNTGCLEDCTQQWVKEYVTKND